MNEVLIEILTTLQNINRKLDVVYAINDKLDIINNSIMSIQGDNIPYTLEDLHADLKNIQGDNIPYTLEDIYDKI